MGTNGNHQHSYEKNGTKPPSKERSAKLMILQTSLSLFSKELTEGESNFWLSLLDDWTVNEMRYAFDNWNRNGRYFPKPKEIIEQIDAYRLTSKPKSGYPGCDAICKARHWKGYGHADMFWLYRRYQYECKKLKRILTDPEVEALLQQLDELRGEAPAWRKHV